MPHFRVTWAYEQNGFGWTESLFKESASHDDAKTAGLALARKRMKLGAVPLSLTYLRVSDDAIVGDSVVSEVKFVVITNNADIDANPDAKGATAEQIKAAVGDAADRPYSAINLRMEGGPLYRRTMYLRGNPDFIISSGNILKADNNWTEAFKAYVKELQAGWKFKVLDKDPVTNPAKTISGVTGGNDKLTYACTGHNFPLGSKVRIRGVKGEGTASPNGLVTVTEVFQDSFATRDKKGTYDYLSGGKATLQKPTYVVISDVIVRKPTTRKTGRPFDSARGRRSSRR